MPRPDVSAERKPQILAAAARVFMRAGIDAARMEDVAREAGLSVGGVYWYFKSKDELVLALMGEVMGSDLSGLRELLAQPGSLRQRLETYIRASLGEAMRLLPLTYEIYSLAGRDAAVREQLKAYFHAYRAVLAELVAQGVARGELRLLDPAAAALTLSALYEGFLELTLLDAAAVQTPTALFNSLDLLLRGMAAED